MLISGWGNSAHIYTSTGVQRKNRYMHFSIAMNLYNQNKKKSFVYSFSSKRIPMLRQACQKCFFDTLTYLWTFSLFVEWSSPWTFQLFPRVSCQTQVCGFIRQVPSCMIVVALTRNTPVKAQNIFGSRVYALDNVQIPPPTECDLKGPVICMCNEKPWSISTHVGEHGWIKEHRTWREIQFLPHHMLRDVKNILSQVVLPKIFY